MRRFPIASPAIDNGAPVAGVTTDARGVPRPFDEAGVTPTTAGGDNSDIGAFEHLPYVNNNAGNALADSGAGSLRDTFAAVPAGTFVIFDPDFFGNSLTTGIARTISLSGGEISLGKNTSIVGTTANALTIQNTAAASATSRVFEVSSGFTVDLSGMTVTGGNPTDDGGGIFNAGTLTLRFVHVTGNTSASFGGGIRGFDGTLNVYHSTVSNNTANASGGTGGGIDSNGHLTLTNSTISGNRVPNDNNNGGGIWSGASGATIINSTITDNEAAGVNRAGGVYSTTGTVNVRDTIIAANRNNATTPDVFVTGGGAFASNGYNLIGNRGVATAFTQIGDQTGTGGAGNQLDPLLAPLAANGGRATPTHALTFDSPALDKGNCFGCSLDQRLVTRPVDLDDATYPEAVGGDASDIGAVERQEPAAADDSYTTNKDTALSKDAGNGVLANDSGTGGTLSAALVTGPSHATSFTLNADGSFSYTPAQGYNGPDQFTYTVTDGASGLSDTGVVFITVNAPPIVTAQSITTDEDTAQSIILTGSDIDSSALTFVIVNGPAHGSLSGTPPNVTYTPASNYNGSDSFTFKANDGQADSNTATISITVVAVNDAPSFVKGPDQAVSRGSGPQTVANWASSILAGSGNESGQSLMFVVTNNNNSLFTSQPAISPDGTLTYTPAPGAAGTVTVTVVLMDSGGTANNGQDKSASMTFTITITPSLTQALNISSRLRVETRDNVMIGGFIIRGNVTKRVVLRGLGPSLVNANVPADSVLNDPMLELHGPNGALITSNDNWKDSPQRSQIENTPFQPSDDRESVIVATLSPGAYTVILSGVLNTSGVGLVEVYDDNQAADSDLANISTRGLVQTGENVLIGGFILGGTSNDSARMAVRGIGPSLSQSGLTGLLADPTLELHDANGATMISNDNWMDDSATAAELGSDGLAPNDPNESAIIASLPPGQFTAILAGKNGGVGIGLIEIYNLQ